MPATPERLVRAVLSAMEDAGHLVIGSRNDALGLTDEEVLRLLTSKETVAEANQ